MIGTASCVATTLGLFAQAAFSLQAQIPLHGDDTAILGHGRKLHGRFLQVTDFHPDRFYEVYSGTGAGEACHRGTGPAGYYGAETSECDAPISLVNATFDWIEAELKDSIDFVLWTGDSARHDNDETIPRSTEQVVSLNEFMVQKFVEVFGKEENEGDTNALIIPVVPSFGNNDILPHNIFSKGPNTWTKNYLSIWKNFIPEEQRHQFDQGGWFSVEVIPNHLTVFSLNSLYFFDSNSAVDGCAAKSEPGYRQLEWLRIQLQFLRNRGMKAMIIGHVPPARTQNKHSWDETCWQKYALWMRQYRDVVVGSFYGHMNVDHFMIQDFDDIEKNVNKGYDVTPLELQTHNNETVDAKVSGNYLMDLRDEWAKLPQAPRTKHSKHASLLEYLLDLSDAELENHGVEADSKKKKKKHKDDPAKKPHDPKDFLDQIGGSFGERFSVSHVSPSVVPNYFPTIRVYEYNITGLESSRLHAGTSSWPLLEDTDGETEVEAEDDDVDAERKKKKKKDKKNKKRRFTVPQPPAKSAPPGPAYSPQPLSLLRYVQYYANLTKINGDFDVGSENGEAVERPDTEVWEERWKEGKHRGRTPRDEGRGPHPKAFKYEVLYDTRDDDVYKMHDLTVRSYLDLASRIGISKSHSGKKSLSMESDSDEVTKTTKGKDKKKKKHGKKGKKNNMTWLTFVRRAFVNTIDEQEARDEFGR